MKKTKTTWIKFNDINETIIKKEDISFFNKQQYEVCPISFSNENKTIINYQICIYLLKSELTEIRLLYDSLKNRDFDYKRLNKMF